MERKERKRKVLDSSLICFKNYKISNKDWWSVLSTMISRCMKRFSKTGYNKLPSSRKFIRPNVFIRTRSFLEIKTKKFKLQPQYKKNKFYPKNYGWKQNLVWDQSIIVPLFSDEFRRWFKKDPNVNIRQSILYLKIFQLCIISGWLTKLQMIKFGKQYNKLDLQKLQDPRLCTSYFIIDAGT